ncbi:MAG: hypothetical protein V3V14_06010 [Saprospiraceae bacterium]
MKYLQSPYFNKNETLTELFEIFFNQIKKTNGDIIESNIVWATLFPNKPYDDKRMRKLNSVLLKEFENYLAQKVFDSDVFLKNNMTLRAIREKKLVKLYKSTVSATNRKLENTFNKSTEYLYAKYYNEKEKMDLYSESELLRKRSKNIENEVNISTITNYLDQFYIAEKLKYLVKLQSWKKNFNLKQDIDHKDMMHHMIKSGLYDNNPPIIIYYTIWKTHLEPDNLDNYYKLKQQVEEYIECFPNDEIRSIYDSLLSFSVRRVNKGDLSFQKETLDIYKEALKKEVLFLDGHITATTFNNIVFFALRTNQYDWADDFIKDYGPLLSHQDRLNSVSLSKARVEFYRKNYGQVIDLLQQVEMESVVYNLSAKTLLLSSYYELDEFDALDSFLNSFRVYINREKSISLRKKSLYKKLLSIVKKIIRLLPNDKAAINALILEIEESPGIIIKPWLLEKLREK